LKLKKALPSGACRPKDERAYFNSTVAPAAVNFSLASSAVFLSEAKRKKKSCHKKSSQKKRAFFQ